MGIVVCALGSSVTCGVNSFRSFRLALVRYLACRLLACSASSGGYLEMDYPDYPKNGMMSGSPILGALELTGKQTKLAAACALQLSQR